MMNIRIVSTTKANNYSIRIKSGLLPQFGQIIKGRACGRMVVLTNRTVHKLWYKELHNSFKKAGLNEQLIIVPDGERYKSSGTYNKVISKMLDIGVDRYSTLITFGGGVIGDLGGLVAATFMRGLKLIHIPTTLIAQIDSSIGGKVAIDHPRAKNIIGAFYDPDLVLTDPDILKTLPEKEFTNGLFEAVKIALVRDKKFYKYILNNIKKIRGRDRKTVEYLAAESARLKAGIVQKDPFEKKLRMILNFGHTFGHALETSGGYKNISHGVAVGWGMLLALQLSQYYNYLDLGKQRETIELIRKLVGKSNIKNIDTDKIWKTMMLDKKAKNDKIRFVLLKGIAQPIVREIDKNGFKKSVGKI